jgi:hypothetical protein
MKKYFNKWFDNKLNVDRTKDGYERDIAILAWNAALSQVMEQSQYVISYDQEFKNFKRSIKSLKYK